MLGDPTAIGRLGRFLAASAGAGEATIEELSPLIGGTVTEEHWLLVARFAGGAQAGRQRLVLRVNPLPVPGIGLGRAEEFAVLRAVHAAGVAVPEPLFLCGDIEVIGKPFLVTRWLPGSAAGEGIAGLGPRPDLAERLARELARVHGIAPPPADLAGLGPPPADAARWRLADYAAQLAACDGSGDITTLALDWLARRPPPPVPPVLVHGDFRTGNYLVDEAGFVALLDWEFAGWSDPAEDLGWFCLRCWRFGADEREAGGIVDRDFFRRAYEQASGRAVDPDRLQYWEAMAALRLLVLIARHGARSPGAPLLARRREGEAEMLRLIGATR
jgi:aminoglycoside phosphotransferase (APT) family kinase protein